jgi:hypothetical protein
MLHLANPQFTGLEVAYEMDFLHGVFAEMAKKAGGVKFAAPGDVTITGNSANSMRASHLLTVVNFEWKKCWSSENELNSWIQFDFGVRQISIWHYTVKTSAQKVGFLHFKSWNVEGWKVHLPNPTTNACD